MFLEDTCVQLLLINFIMSLLCVSFLSFKLVILPMTMCLWLTLMIWVLRFSLLTRVLRESIVTLIRSSLNTFAVWCPCEVMRICSLVSPAAMGRSIYRSDSQAVSACGGLLVIICLNWGPIGIVKSAIRLIVVLPNPLLVFSIPANLPCLSINKAFC